MNKILSLLAITAVLGACQNTGYQATSDSTISEMPRSCSLEMPQSAESLNIEYLLNGAPKYYVGSTYNIDGVQYTPTENYDYDQTGVAGIIPMELNGTKTSNGETYDAGQMFATSKSLPLPSIVRVTNLENCKSVIVRINNRGPFLNSRIMDLSPAAAEKLGMTSQSKVQIQILPEQSKIVKAATLKDGSYTAPVATGTLTEESLGAAPVVTETTTVTEAPAPVATGDYELQVTATTSEEGAAAMAAKMQQYGATRIIHEGDFYKVRITGLNAESAKSILQQLNTNEGLYDVGLLKNGKWTNKDTL